jgi:hypothetical protein
VASGVLCLRGRKRHLEDCSAWSVRGPPRGLVFYTLYVLQERKINEKPPQRSSRERRRNERKTAEISPSLSSIISRLGPWTAMEKSVTLFDFQVPMAAD